MFQGIPFWQNEPYTYGQAKRLLKLLREELCKDLRLSKRIEANLSRSGRGAIKGKQGTGVWDMIPLLHARPGVKHTRYAHLTINITRDGVSAYVTIPNGMRSRVRGRLFGVDEDGFASIIKRVTIDMVRSLRSVKGCVPEIIVLQRHWPSRSASSVVDCQLRYDARTTLPLTSRYRGTVKSQPEWLKATYEVLTHRQSNLEFQIGCSFPYDTCPTVADSSIVRAIADVWLACAPIIKRATGGRVRSRSRR